MKTDTRHQPATFVLITLSPATSLNPLSYQLLTWAVPVSHSQPLLNHQVANMPCWVLHPKAGCTEDPSPLSVVWSKSGACDVEAEKRAASRSRQNQSTGGTPRGLWGGPSKGIPVKSAPEPAVPPSGILLPRQLSFEMVVGEDAGSVGGYWTRHASPLLQHRRTKSPSFPLT